MSEPADDAYPFFSKEMVERWVAIPTHKALAIPLGREEVDSLLLSIRQSIIAQSHVAVSLRQFIDGDQAGGAETWDKYQVALHSSFGHINDFMRHVMTSAQVINPDE